MTSDYLEFKFCTARFQNYCIITCDLRGWSHKRLIHQKVLLSLARSLSLYPPVRLNKYKFVVVVVVVDEYEFDLDSDVENRPVYNQDKHSFLF